MYIKNSLKPIIKFYPSIYFNLTKGFIPNFTEIFNESFNKFKSQDAKYFNFKHDYKPGYNNSITTSVQFNYDIVRPNGYTSVSEIRDKSSNTYVYELVQVYERENDYIILNDLHLNSKSTSKVNLNINKNSDIESIMNTISNVNFGIMTYSGNIGAEKILYNMLTTPENSNYYQSTNSVDNNQIKSIIKVDNKDWNILSSYTEI